MGRMIYFLSLMVLNYLSHGSISTNLLDSEDNLFQAPSVSLFSFTPLFSSGTHRGQFSDSHSNLSVSVL